MRNSSVDFFKLLLALMVVALHSEVFSKINTDLSFFLVNGVFRIAVPIFFIIGGYFYKDVANDLIQVKSWIYRLARLYVFWMILYLPFYLSIDISKGSVFLLKDFIFGFWHLWYVQALIFAGIFIYFAKNFEPIKLIFFVFLLYFFGCCLQYVQIFGSISMPTFFYRNAFFFGVPMFSLGYLLSRYADSNFRFFGSPFVGVGAVLLFFSEIIFARYFLDYQKNVDMYFSLFFLCPFLYSKVVGLKALKIRTSVSKFSSFLFFSHPAFVIIFAGIFDVNIDGIVVFFCSVISCFILYMIVRRIQPIMRLAV